MKSTFTSYIHTIARAINQGGQFEYRPHAGEKLSYQELVLLKTINQVSAVIQQIKDPKHNKRLATLAEFHEKIRTIIGLERIKIEEERLAEKKRQHDLMRQKQEEHKQLERAREAQKPEEARTRLEAERRAEQERQRLEEIRRKQQAEYRKQIAVLATASIHNDRPTVKRLFQTKQTILLSTQDGVNLAVEIAAQYGLLDVIQTISKLNTYKPQLSHIKRAFFNAVKNGHESVVTFLLDPLNGFSVVINSEINNVYQDLIKNTEINGNHRIHMLDILKSRIPQSKRLPGPYKAAAIYKLYDLDKIPNNAEKESAITFLLMRCQEILASSEEGFIQGIHHAIEYNLKDIVIYFMENGGYRPDDSRLDSIMMKATQFNRLTIIKYLLTKIKLNPSKINSYFDDAVREGQVDIVRYFLNHDPEATPEHTKISPTQQQIRESYKTLRLEDYINSTKKQEIMTLLAKYLTHQPAITIQKRIRGNRARNKILPKMEERKLAFIMTASTKIHEHLEKYKLIRNFLSPSEISQINIGELESAKNQILSLLDRYYGEKTITLNYVWAYTRIIIHSDQYKNLINAIKRYNIDTMLAPPDSSNPSLYPLNRYFETNKELPNKYAGLGNEDLRKEKLKWIFEHRDHIDFDLLTHVFESHKTKRTALTADEVENPDTLVIAPESFKDFDAESTPILSPEKVRQNLLAEAGDGHAWTGAITRFKGNFQIIIALCNAVGGADNLTTDIIRNGVRASFSTNGSSGLGISYDAWVNNIYYIGRALVELQQIKQTKKDVYRDILTDLLIRLASAGGHCEYGLNDVNTIYDRAKTLIPFSDSLAISTVLSVDDKVQRLLLSLRENVFKKVTTFETDTETNLTPLNYRRRFAERLGIAKAPEENHFAQTGSGRVNDYGNLITTTFGLTLREGHLVYTEIPLPQYTNLTNPEFLDRFFVGKHTGIYDYRPLYATQNTLLEYNKKYEGYSPYQIFLQLQKAVNNPESNDPDSVGVNFDDEFIWEYCRTLPNTHPFVQSILRSNSNIKHYYKDNILRDPNYDLADISAEEVKYTRDMLIKQLNDPNSAIATKQDLLVFGGYLFEERQTHGTRKFRVHDDIIIDYLARKNIIVPIDVIPGYKFFFPSILRN